MLYKRPNTTAVMKTIYSFIISSDKNTLSLWALAQSKNISTSILLKSVLFFGTKIILCMYYLLGINFVNLNFKAMRKGKVSLVYKYSQPFPEMVNA